MRIHGEERLASLIAAAGVIWGVRFATSSSIPPAAMVFPPGPLETCGVGILVWLHAKWRRANRSI
jgi:hypothetical protein